MTIPDLCNKNRVLVYPLFIVKLYYKLWAVIRNHYLLYTRFSSSVGEYKKKRFYFKVHIRI